MNLRYIERTEILIDRFGDQFLICLFKPLPDFSMAGGAILIVNSVACYAVDEEKRKHLDTLAFQYPFFFEMLLDGLEHLCAHHVVAKATHFLTQFKSSTLIEFEIF